MFEWTDSLLNSHSVLTVITETLECKMAKEFWWSDKKRRRDGTDDRVETNAIWMIGKIITVSKERRIYCMARTFEERNIQECPYYIIYMYIINKVWTVKTV
jgi:hypothetical protein